MRSFEGGRADGPVAAEPAKHQEIEVDFLDHLAAAFRVTRANAQQLLHEYVVQGQRARRLSKAKAVTSEPRTQSALRGCAPPARKAVSNAAPNVSVMRQRAHGGCVL